MSWPDLQRQVAALALHLKSKGVGRGDRVAAYLPNIPETVVAFLATASIGAVWSVCAPDMAAPAVIDRFKQIEPKVLIACDAVTYAGRRHDRARRGRGNQAHTADGRARHPARRRRRRASSDALLRDHSRRHKRCDRCVRAGVAAVRSSALDRLFQRNHGPAETDRAWPWRRRARGAAADDAAQRYRLQLRARIRSANAFTGTRSTGWIMWNCQVNALLNGTTCLPVRRQPWRLQGQTGLDHAVAFCGRDQRPRYSAPARRSLPVAPRPRSISAPPAISRVCARSARPARRSAPKPSTGSTSVSRAREVNGSQAQAEMWWANISGGTDFAGAFIGGNRELPQTSGRDAVPPDGLRGGSL